MRLLKSQTDADSLAKWLKVTAFVGKVSYVGLWIGLATWLPTGQALLLCALSFVSAFGFVAETERSNLNKWIDLTNEMRHLQAIVKQLLEVRKHERGD